MTFENSISDGLHLRDHRFGATVLAVCALASKNSPDKRVLSSDGPHAEFSAGWKWFQQIRSPFGYTGISTLYDLQLCCVSCCLTGIDVVHKFLSALSSVPTIWIQVGIRLVTGWDRNFTHRGHRSSHRTGSWTISRVRETDGVDAAHLLQFVRVRHYRQCLFWATASVIGD